MRIASHQVINRARPGRGRFGRTKVGVVAFVVMVAVVLASSASTQAAVLAPYASVGMPLATSPGLPPSTPGAVPLASGETDVAYGPLAAHRLDIFRATSATRRGTVAFIHGGGFNGGDKDEIQEALWAPILAERDNGFDVVSINYRLTEEAPYPAAFDDAALAVSWIIDHGAQAGLDNSRVIVIGHSAGGALAAMIGTRPGAATQFGAVPRVESWVGIAPVLDFRASKQISRDFPRDWGIAGSSERTEVSPLANLDPTDPPGYLIHGDHDNVVSITQSDTFVLSGAAMGARVTYDRVDFDPLGRPPAECLWHTPLCAADMAQFDSWLLHRSV